MSEALYPRGVDFVSSTRLDHGNFLTGDIRWAVDPADGRTKKYTFFKAAGTIADGVGFKKDATTGSEITVIASAAAADVLEGVNNTGVSLASGNYFWGLTEGVGYGAPDGTGWNDGDPLCGSATAAKFGVATVGTHHPIGKAINDDNATVNLNLIYFKF